MTVLLVKLTFALTGAFCQFCANKIVLRLQMKSLCSGIPPNL